MKFILNIDEKLDEEIIINVKKRTPLVDEIEKLVLSGDFELLCFNDDKTAVIKDFSDIHCFAVQNNKVYAYTDNEKFLIKYRIYQLIDKMPSSFIKVNQSCIGNINKIERFDTSFTGSLLVKFKCGYSDYVSRRQLRNFKERFGL